MPRRCRENAIIGRFTPKLGRSPAHRDYADARLIAGVIDCTEQGGKAVRRSFDQNDIGSGSHGVGPLDVERRLQRPARVGRGRAQVVDGERGRSGEAVLLVKGSKVGTDVRVVVGIDDGDGLSRTVAGNLAARERDLVYSVSVLDLLRGIARRP